MEFEFKSKAAGERARLLAAFGQFATEKHLPRQVIAAADLAIEEHLTNILTHAFRDDAEHIIHLRFAVSNHILEIEITDQGKPFDPTRHPKPDLNIPAERRPIGGLGIHMIHQAMDSVEHERKAGRNILRMRKRIPH